MPSGQRNSIMAKAMGLIFSLFNITSAEEVPFGMPQYVQWIPHELTDVLLCMPFIFADSRKCQFGGGMCWLPFTTEIVYIFVVATLITKELCEQLLIRIACVMVECYSSDNNWGVWHHLLGSDHNNYFQ